MNEHASSHANNEALVQSVKQYVDVCAEAANRARTILIVLVTASVLTFVATWNTKPDAWLTTRINRATAALDLFDPKTNKLLKDDAPERNNLKGADPELFQSSLTYIETRKFNDREVLLDYLKHLRRMQAERITTISIPFFGVILDVNDLAMFAGFTFVVILLWFKYSLSRELNNLRLTFEEAEKREQLRLCYDMLAMQQVLTVPPLEHQGRKRLSKFRAGFWRVLPKILFALPLTVLLYLCWHDYNTSRLALGLNEPHATLVFWSSRVMLIIILGLTITSYRLSRKIDREWKIAECALAEGKKIQDCRKKRAGTVTEVESKITASSKENA